MRFGRCASQGRRGVTLRTAYRVNRIPPGAGDQVEQVLTDLSTATGDAWWLTEHQGETWIRCAFWGMPWTEALKIVDGEIRLTDINTGRPAGTSEISTTADLARRSWLTASAEMRRGNRQIMRDDPCRPGMIPIP